MQVVVEVEAGRLLRRVVGVPAGGPSDQRCERPDLSFCFEHSTEVWQLVRDSGERVPVPPYDWTMAGLAHLPSLPGATVAVRESLTGGPFGPVSTDYRAIDGRLCEVRRSAATGTLGAVDTWFDYPYRRALEFRLGQRSVLGLVAPPARLGGDLAAAMVVAGLLDHLWMEASPLSSDELNALLMLTDALDGAPLVEPTSARQPGSPT